MKSVIGIAIGGTKTAVTLAKFDGTNFSDITKKVTTTNPNNDQETIKNIISIINSFDVKVEEISIISGGPLDVVAGTIDCPPHLPGFNHTPIVKIFKDLYKCPVSLLNDADACALAEFKYGAGKSSINMGFLTFGTGYGCGLILNKKLYTGNNGMAGEIGHVKLTDHGPLGYGVEGSAEGYCAGGNIYKWSGINGISNTKELFDMARSGDQKALEVIDKVGERLGQSISILLDVLNLDTVVLGGIYARNLDILEERVIENTRKYSLNSNFSVCKIVPAELGEQIDDYSSLMCILNK